MLNIVKRIGYLRSPYMQGLHGICKQVLNLSKMAAILDEPYASNARMWFYNKSSATLQSYKK